MVHLMGGRAGGVGRCRNFEKRIQVFHMIGKKIPLRANAGLSKPDKMVLARTCPVRRTVP